MKAVIVLYLLIQALYLSGCAVCWGKRGCNEYKAVIAQNNNTNAMAIEKFSSYPVDKQIDIHLYANYVGNGSVGRFIARHDGANKVQRIVQRIRTEPQLWDKASLIDALFYINEECRCIKQDSDVIRTLVEVENALQRDPNLPANYAYKDIYSMSLTSLKNQIERQSADK